jgi:hypothetical protein
MKQVKKILALLILLITFSANGEDVIDDASNDSATNDYLLDDYIMDCSMGLEYQLHEDFVLIKKMECFDSIPKLHWALTCMENKFNSNNHIKVFVSVQAPIDSSEYARFLPQNTIIPVNTQHIYQIIGDIRFFYDYTQEEAEKKWQKDVYYFSQEEAMQICNADTLISYTLALSENEYYEGRYKHIAVYFMQKHNRGNIGLYCFYDDEAAKKTEKYMKNIIAMFHYREPFTKKPLPKGDFIVIDVPPKQKKGKLRENDVFREIIEQYEENKKKNK